MNGVRRDWDHWAEMDYAKEIGFTAGRDEGWEEGIAVGESRGMEKVFALLEQGVSLAEAKRKLGLL